jgi:hypothetical protein
MIKGQKYLETLVTERSCRDALGYATNVTADQETLTCP